MKRNSGLFLTVCKKNAKKYFDLFVYMKISIYLCTTISKNMMQYTLNNSLIINLISILLLLRRNEM